MDVSFTGIHNLYLGKRPLNKNEIISLTKNGENELKYGIVTKLKADLTNDSFGKDLDDYLKVMSRFNHGYVNIKDPKNVELQTMYSVTEGVVDESMAGFNFNGKYLPLSENKDLAMFDYMAKLTRNILRKPNLSQDAKNLVQFINDVVAESAKTFID